MDNELDYDNAGLCNPDDPVTINLSKQSDVTPVAIVTEENYSSVGLTFEDLLGIALYEDQKTDTNAKITNKNLKQQNNVSVSQSSLADILNLSSQSLSTSARITQLIQEIEEYTDGVNLDDVLPAHLNPLRTDSFEMYYYRNKRIVDSFGNNLLHKSCSKCPHSFQKKFLRNFPHFTTHPFESYLDFPFRCGGQYSEYKERSSKLEVYRDRKYFVQYILAPYLLSLKR
jgi:hypothetical protein